MVASALPNGLRSLAYSIDSLMQNCAAPRLDAAWRMRFSLKKCCTTCSPRPSPPKIAPSGTRTSVSEMWAWSVGMLNVQRNSSILNPGELVGTRKAVIPSPSPGLPLVRAKIRSYWAVWMPVFHVFSPLMTQLVAVALGVGLHERGVGAVLRFGDAEGEAAPPLGQVVDPLGLLLVGAVLDHQQQADVVADDRVLVLQVAVQPEALRGEVLADHGHAEVRAVLAAVLLGERVAVVAGGVGPPPGLAQQGLPLARSAGRRGPSRCGRPRGGGRRSGCCRPVARAA